MPEPNIQSQYDPRPSFKIGVNAQGYDNYMVKNYAKRNLARSSGVNPIARGLLWFSPIWDCSDPADL